MLYKLQYNQVHKSADNSLFNWRCFHSFREISREYVGTFLHPIGVSLAESFNLVSNVWHVEMTM